MRGDGGFTYGDCARRYGRVEVRRVGREESHAERVSAHWQDRSDGREINLGAWNGRVVALVPPIRATGINMVAVECGAVGDGVHAIDVGDRRRHFVDREVLRDRRAVPDGGDRVVTGISRRGGRGGVVRRSSALVAVGVGRVKGVAAPGKANGGKLSGACR